MEHVDNSIRRSSALWLIDGVADESLIQTGGKLLV